VGIVVAHGVLAASWAKRDAPTHRASVATCVRTPEDTPNFEPPRELLARADIPIARVEVLQP